MTSEKINKKILPSMRSREKILDAAARRFAEEDFQGCSLDTIAQAVEITKGAIHTHFASRSELFVATIRHAYERALDKVHEFEGRPPGVVAIVALLSECVHNPEFPINHNLYAEILAMTSRDPLARATFLNYQENFRLLLERRLEAGIRNAGINPALDASGTVEILFTLGNGLVVRLSGNEEDDFQECFAIFENAVRMILSYPARYAESVQEKASGE